MPLVSIGCCWLPPGGGGGGKLGSVIGGSVMPVSGADGVVVDSGTDGVLPATEVGL